METKHTPGPWKWVEHDDTWPCEGFNHLVGTDKNHPNDSDAGNWVLMVRAEIDDKGVVHYGIDGDDPINKKYSGRKKADLALIAAAPRSAGSVQTCKRNHE